MIENMLWIHPQFSLFAAIKLCDCFKVTIGLLLENMKSGTQWYVVLDLPQT